MTSNSNIPMPLLDWHKDNKQSAFQEWKDFMQSYFAINKTADAEQWNFILLSSGSRGRELFLSTNLTEEEKQDPQRVWDMFEGYMVEKPNKWVQRIELQSYAQGPDETIEAFTLRLRNKSLKCSFSSEEIRDDRIVEQLIKGCRYQEEKKKLIAKGDKLDLSQAVTMAKSYEASVKHLEEYSSAEKARPQTDSLDTINKRNRQCSKCKTMHEQRQCPAFGTVCRICQKPNHWAKACRSRTGVRNAETRQTLPQNRGFSHSAQKNWNKKNKFKRPNVHNLKSDTYDDQSEEDDLSIDTLSTKAKDKRNEIFTRIQIKVPEKTNTYKLKVKIDTGANANTMTMRSFKQIYPEKSKEQQTKIWIPDKK